MIMSTGLIIDLILMALLVVAIGFCWRLDRRLNALKTGQDGFRAAARELAESVTQAEQAIRQLGRSRDDVGRELQDKIDEARLLAGALGSRVSSMKRGL
jgi:hypothetical protein